MNEDEHSTTEAYRLMPASLWTRAAAFVGDSLVMIPVILLVTWLFGTNATAAGFNAGLAHAGLALYFAILEGLWGTTPGKFFSRIRVVGKSGPPGIPRAALRCGLFFGYLWIIQRLGDAVNNSLEGFPEVLLDIAFGPLSSLALFSTARQRSGMRGVHDLISGTWVVEVNRRDVRREL